MHLGILFLLSGSALSAQKADPNPPHTESSNRAIAEKFSRYRQYTMEQGLSSNWINAIDQDEDGFMWFGTNEGLNRFDGERFTSFFYKSDGTGLPSDRITKMLSLPGNKLLIGTEKGCCVLHTRSLKFEPLPLPDGNGVLKNDAVIWALHQAQNGQIWMSAGSGICVLQPDLEVLYTYFKPSQGGDTSGDVFARDFLELADGTIAVKCAQKDFRYMLPWQVIDFQNQRSQALSTMNPAFGVLDSALVSDCVVKDPKNNLWITCYSNIGPVALYRFDWAQKKASTLLPNTAFKSNKPQLGQYRHPILLPDSLLMLQRFFGPPLLYNLRDGSTTDLPTWRSSAPDGKIIINFVDRDSNLWLCPRFEGIFFLTLKNLPAITMTALNTTHKTMMKKTGVSEEWFGFSGLEHAGKWVVSSSNGGLYSMDKSEKGVKGIVSSNPFNGYAYVRNFATDHGDTLWISSLDGLHWYCPTKNTTGPLKARFKGLDSLDSRFIYRDRFGLIWGRVLHNGVCCFDTRTRKLTHFPSQGSNPVFPLRSATACTQAPDGDMWFSFGSEMKYLARWRRSSGVFEKVEPINPKGITCSKAFDLMADREGNLWLFVDLKWYVMNIETRVVKPFGKADGLATNSPEGRCIDRDGNLWFATAYGLSRYDPKNFKIRTFFQTDGLLSNDIKNVELLDTLHNTLFVSTDQGMCLFEPDKIGAAAPAPSTFITSLIVSDLPVSLPSSGMLQLLYHQNDLRVEFTGVNFINGASNRYQYSIETEGSPADWKDAGTDNFANFLNVAPGRYRFRARTANSDGVWGLQEASLNIVIYPPWWQTWTFRISMLALFIGLIWAANRRQILRTEHREKEKAQVRQQLADLEMKALRSQMNPHFVFNALNSVQNFILKNDTREASKYLTKFARLMRLILENSESPMVSLSREIELLRYYTELEQLRFSHRFSFDFQIDPALNPESISIPGMLIQPHIENAIWHGLMHKSEPGHLWIRFKKADEKTLICEIEDNGLGRAKAAEIEKDRPKNHRSTGLANIRNRLELLNAQLAEDIRLDFEDLHDPQGVACGTKVLVRMPIVA